jgi:hypothetical protein
MPIVIWSSKTRKSRRAGAAPLLVLALCALCAGACATYQEDLNRAQRLYHENEYERALAIFRVLEEDTVTGSAFVPMRVTGSLWRRPRSRSIRGA